MSKKEVKKSTAKRQAPDFQGKTIHKILSKDHCVEWTAKISEAETAYKDATAPKQWWLVQPNGSDVRLLREDR